MEMRRTQTHTIQFTEEDTSVSWDHAEIAFSMGVMRLPDFYTTLSENQVDAKLSEFNTSKQRNHAPQYRGGKQ